MIAASNICFKFPEHNDGPVLLNVSLNVSPGCVVAVVGPSGCGKTTFLRILSGYLKPDSGEVEIDGNSPQNAEHKIGVLFQDNRLLPWRNVIQNILLPIEIRNSKPEQRDLAELLTLLRLTEHEDKFPSQLSGGLQGRVALARALISSPKILLLDEPLGSTDYIHRLEIENYIVKITRENKRCCLIITHDLEQAVAMADQIFILGFPRNSQPSSVLEVPSVIRTAAPSDARTLSDTPIFLRNVLDEFKKVAAL